MKQHNYFVYNTTNPSRTVLYIGVTNDLQRRMSEHSENRGKSDTFAGRYYCYNLLYYERHQHIRNAIEREKEIKLMKRADKDVLIRSANAGMAFLKM